MADNTIRFTFVIDDKGKVKVDQLGQSFKNLDQAIDASNKKLKQQATQLGVNTKEKDNMINKTGLAGAALVELSRTISDSNYGFTAMANNISQLSTLMITLFATSGGVVGGFKELGKAFAGPLGLIVLFNIFIARLEKSEMGSKKLKKTTDLLKGAFSEASGDLQTFLKVVDRGVISNRDLDESLIALQKRYPDLNIQLNENRRLTDESRKAIERKIETLRELARTQAIQKELEKVYADRVKVEVETEEKIDAIRKEASSNLLQGATLASSTFRDRNEEERQGREARISVLEKERDEELKILSEKENRLISFAEQTGRAAGLFGGKDNPFVVAGKITKQAMDSIFPEEEKTPGQKYAEDILKGFDTVELGAKKHTRSMEEINFILAMIDADRLDIFASATDALAGLFGERTAAGKAFAVATATMDTYAGANLALKDPTIPNTFARIAAVTAVIATGLANVRNILAVDENGRGVPSSASAGGSQAESQAPIFNVVGASNIDQIGRAVASSRNEPVRAYVVGHEITNQQELDNKIVESASIG